MGSAAALWYAKSRLGEPHLGHLVYREGQIAEVTARVQGPDDDEPLAIFEVGGAQGEFRVLAQVAARIVGGVARAEHPLRWLDPRDRRLRCTLHHGRDCRASDIVELVPAPRLCNPRWLQSGDFRHGEVGRLEVEAPGFEGRTVRFLIELQIGGGWRPYRELTAGVRRGVARAEVPLVHPLPPPEARRADIVALEPAPLRFHALIAQ